MTAVVDNISCAPVDVEDGGVAVIRFANGALAILHCGYCLPEGYELSFNLHGSQGWVRWVPMDPELHIFSTAPAWEWTPEKRISYSLKETSGYCGYQGIELLRDWIAAIREDRQPVNTAKNALRVLEVVDAIYMSSTEGKFIKIKI